MAGEGEPNDDRPEGDGERADKLASGTGPAAEPPTEDVPVGVKSSTEKPDPQRAPPDEPTEFDRKQQQTDVTIKRFTVVNGLAAAISAAAAVYAASQIVSASRQTDTAIHQIANLAVQTKRQADLAVDANAEAQSIANEANKRTDRTIRASQTMARAAVAGVDQQERHFRLDERPIVAEGATPPDIKPGPHFDASRQEFAWNYGLKNYGKTTAVKIVGREYVSILGSPFSSELRFREFTDLVPTAPAWSSALYGHPVSEDTVKAARSVDKGIIVKVLLKYEDISGLPYTEELCFYTSATGIVHTCSFSDVANIPTEEPNKLAAKHLALTCSSWQKLPEGTWIVILPTTINGITYENVKFGPHYMLDGIDLTDQLDRQCQNH